MGKNKRIFSRKELKLGNQTNGLIESCSMQWKDIPNYYPLHQSVVYSRFCKWRDSGVFKRIFYVLVADADLENLCIDSTCVKAHPQNSGAKKGL